MQRLEVSGVVRTLHVLLGVKGLIYISAYYFMKISYG